MKKSSIFILICFSLYLMMMSSCSSNTSDIPEDADLVIVGNVKNEVGWMEDTIQEMETMNVESKNSKGESEIYTGVSIKSLLDKAGVNPDATTIIFFSEDGSSSGEIPLVDVLSCEQCILSFRTKGGFSVVAPNLGKEVQIKGVIKLELK